MTLAFWKERLKKHCSGDYAKSSLWEGCKCLILKIDEGGAIRKEAGIWCLLYHLLHLVALGKYSNICESLFLHPDCGKSDYNLNGLLRDDVWKPTRAVLGS